MTNPNDPMPNFRQELIDDYEKLSPAEQRARLLILPEYANERDEYLQPDRIVAQFRYFWDFWVPKLGPLPSLLYMKLRQFAYYNRQTGELREALLQFPKQADLAVSLGVKKRQTIADSLVILENHGLIRREKRYRYDATSRKKIRTTDRFWVQLTDILTPEHQVEILLKGTTGKPAGISQDRPMSEKRTQVEKPPVDNSQPMSEKRTAEELSEKRTANSLLISTINVDQRLMETSSKAKPRATTLLATDPRVLTLDAQERQRKDALADEIGEVLKAMTRDRDPNEHRSAGFHRVVAYLMPESAIRDALAITRDAVDDTRAGSKSLGSPSAYFGGVVRNKAQELGINLNLKWRPRSETPVDLSR